MFKHLVEPLRWSETPVTFDRHDHWVHLPRPGAYPLVVSPVVSQVRLAKVLIDDGSALDIIFSSTLAKMMSRALPPSMSTLARQTWLTTGLTTRG